MLDYYNKIIGKIGKVGSTVVSDDKSTSDNLGNFFKVEKEKLLGHGSYGNVYLAKDINGNFLAAKCCEIDGTGIPNILEASIMTSILHPCLNRACLAYADDKMLYIFQELARIDLAQHTRRDKGNVTPSLPTLKQWCFSLAQATNVLHQQNIIHADIKASNVLLYIDESVRLTDFTLSIKKWKTNEKFTHNVCTSTHRPLECFLKKEWDEKLDVWSLGCTFYEIAYGESLFPYQGVLEKEEVKDVETKLRSKQRFINAIIDWAERGPNASVENIDIKRFPVDFIAFELCKDFKKPEMKVFNDLLCSMLRVDPDKRPNMDKVMKHPFFQGLEVKDTVLARRTLNKIPIPEHARISRFIQRYSDNDIVQKLAMDIYCRCNDIGYLSEHVRAAGCTWIASKLVLGYPPDIDNNLESQILLAEREICHNVKFHLHDT